ncbi:PLP-dependent aminotransferase family protein [Streptomyces sp. PSAA01]|uniref:aminotransferase-like domain-containing protein n=1 Tax=Streptomyces sp. PSAA01 TaxID=2912762 RepID=UPI001F3BE541|nr:PLP-dependent aminotransferase family protein [Streptomyces sp. PSAA01]MCG0286188.1 PLP-dependent aminotransferase family protein [Streptomyces sp. PSAA01]
MIHFSRGIPPREAIPTEAITRLTRRVLDTEADRLFQYPPIGKYAGDPDLRRELAAFHGTEAERIFVTNGSLQALDLLAGHLVHPGDVVYVEAPTYDRAVQIFERHGAKVVGVPLEHDGLDVAALAQLVAAHVPAFVYTIPDFQNPSGVTMNDSKRRELVRLAAEYEFTVIEDIPYRELRYTGTASASLAELDLDNRVVTVGSLSKVLSPGLRIGYVIADPALVTDLAGQAEGVYLSPSPLSQAIGARCLAEGLVQSNVADLRRLMAPRLSAAVDAVREQLGEILVAAPEGGYYLTVHLPVANDEATFLADARAVGVVLTRGSAFYPDGSMPPQGTIFLRLPFQAMEPEEFAAGIGRLASLIA